MGDKSAQKKVGIEFNGSGFIVASSKSEQEVGVEVDKLFELAKKARKNCSIKSMYFANDGVFEY